MEAVGSSDSGLKRTFPADPVLPSTSQTTAQNSPWLIRFQREQLSFSTQARKDGDKIYATDAPLHLRDFSNPAANWVGFNLFHETAVQGLRAELES